MLAIISLNYGMSMHNLSFVNVIDVTILWAGLAKRGKERAHSYAKR